MSKKTTSNKSIHATTKLHIRALKVGIESTIIEKSKPATRRYNPCGSTYAPQKTIILNGLRMSIGQAAQYITAREH